MLMKPKRGFTLIELIMVIAIIGVVGAIAMVVLSDARMKGRDNARKSQVQEILKALELYYTDNGAYPQYGSSSGTGGTLDGINSSFFGVGTYLKRLPAEAGTHYYYCVSADRKSILLALDTEQDKGGSDYCSIPRGSGPDYGCAAWQVANAGSPCGGRF